MPPSVPKSVAFALFLALSWCAVSNAAGTAPPASISLTFGSDIGPINPSTTLGHLSSGLYAVPETGGTPTRHPFLFKWANNVLQDASSQTLWAFDVDDSNVLKVWSYASWTAANLDDPAFNPVPLYTLANFTYITQNYIWYYMMNSVNGSYYIFASSYDSLYIDRFTPSGNTLIYTHLLNYQPPFPNNAYLVSNDQSLLYVESYDPDGNLNSNVTVYSISSDLSNLTWVRDVVTQCPAGSNLQFIEATRDNKTLVAGCWFGGYELFNITVPNNPISIGWYNDSVPEFGCQYGDGQTGSGSADLSAPPAWMNYVNDTYVTADVLTSTNPPTLTRFYPLDNNIWWCAATPNQQVVLIGPQYLQVFSTSSATTPLYSARTVCAVLNWVGSIAGRSVFFHARSPECNCADLANKPCPIGMALTSSQGPSYVTPFTASYGPYFLSGRDYEESIATDNYTQVVGANLTWQVEPVFFDNTNLVFPTIVPCFNRTVTIDPADYGRFAGKWVLVGLGRRSTPCGDSAHPSALYDFLYSIGAKGVLLQALEGALAYPGNSLPFLGIEVSNEMGFTLLAAWNASICAATPGCVTTVATPTVATPTTTTAATPTTTRGPTATSAHHVSIFSPILGVAMFLVAFVVKRH